MIGVKGSEHYFFEGAWRVFRFVTRRHRGIPTIEAVDSKGIHLESALKLPHAGGMSAITKVPFLGLELANVTTDQFLDWITDVDGDRFKSPEDMLVEFQTEPIIAGTEKLRGFVNSSDISGYSASGELHLALDSNVLQWKGPCCCSQVDFSACSVPGSQSKGISGCWWLVAASDVVSGHFCHGTSAT